MSPSQSKAVTNNPAKLSEIVARRNQLLNGAHKTRGQHCDACGWVCFPTTKFCTRPECENSPNKCDRLDGAEFRKRFQDPGLFHGRSWGCFSGWTFDAERLALVYQATPLVRKEDDPNEMYLGWFGLREIDLETITSSSQLLDVIFQTRQWASNDALVNLIHALDEIIRPQANLCSGGTDKRIDNPAEFLKARMRQGESHE